MLLYVRDIIAEKRGFLCNNMGKFIDLTGQRFGKLTVISRAESNSQNRAMWSCLCDCKKTIITTGWSLRRGSTKSCGCIGCENLIGKKFCRLSVISKYGSNKHKKIVYECLCECGNKTKIIGSRLKNGHTKSCGCLHLENIKNGTNTRHGLSNHKLNNVWNSIKDRCFNKNNKDYKHYGGRGIIMCDEWKNDFKKFYDWAILNGYKKGLSIDRIDNNGNYTPENCRLVTQKEQVRNTRINRKIEYNGDKKLIIEWCEELNLKLSVITNRIYRGWSVEKTFETPIKTKSKV